MEQRVTFQFRQTVATIIGEERYLDVARHAIMQARAELERYLRADPFFGVTYEPCSCLPDAPEIAKRMAEVGMKVGVGPMASVAGGIAQCAVEAMVESGATHAIVDNGGDIAMYLDHPVVAGIYTGDASLEGIGLRIEEEGRMTGVCTSSGKVGHSVSFGNAHAATVIARDVALADAAATALGNAVQGEDEEGIRHAMNGFCMGGIEGILVVVGGYLALRGRVPRICSTHAIEDHIMKGR